MNIALVLTTVNAQHVTGIEFVAIIRAPRAGVGGGGGVHNKVLYGEARPVVQPLAFYIPFLGKRVALLGFLQTEMTDFPAISYTSTSETLTFFIYLKIESGIPFGKTLPV